MASRAETSAVYGAGIVQGIALVTFPAASTILTDPDEYDLSSTQYAGLFLPQVITAIAASLLGARLGERYGTKRVYLSGLVATLAAMTLLLVSQFYTDDHSLAYALLLLATLRWHVGPIPGFLMSFFGVSVLRRLALVGLARTVVEKAG